VAERGDAGVKAVRELTNGIGADAALECVGTDESVVQALKSARPGGMVGWVGVPHVTDIPQEHMFWKNVGLRGGPAPVRAYLPDLLRRVWERRIDPGMVFDLTLPLSEVAEAYAAMDERRAVKVLLRS
jgi:threonine dehydrogenase-like Zn-dependent dehydrogenase